ncbi:N-acetylmuramate alpha-1-phosphate uridylyltransferase MurU [Parachitinimonas caeni]|uniref:Nucleotidyltransferase family protein n=1 Tax=Parachitinimonas caeni TaxID=3031301 RepID=A0ABT7DSJ3_9NEIS|nr:nucleotidyltransferase family protein [Parachitinimonas caeni]MDK2123026.1 nucleotidyltransferase family protein [Parachitinimonas caeni]
MKAMILAAGRGERMRPLTDTTPKPLLPLKGKPLIVWHLERLSDAGVTEVIINHAWLGSQIEATLGDGQRWGIAIRYSAEGYARETAGGIALVRDWLGNAPFLLLSGDIYTDYPLGSLIAQAPQLMANPEVLAHLVMVNNPDYHPLGDFGLINGYINPNLEPRYTYGNLALMRIQLVEKVRAGEVAKLGPLLVEAGEKGGVSGEYFGGRWFNLGTPSDLSLAEAVIMG